MLSAMHSMIFAISAGFSDLKECDTDSLIVTQRRSVICGNIVRHIAHHSCEFSRMISRSSGVGKSCRSAAIKDLALLYCARDKVTGCSFRVITALSKSDKAGALDSLPPGKSRFSSIADCVLTGLFRLSRTLAAGRISFYTIRLEAGGRTYLPAHQLASSDFVLFVGNRRQSHLFQAAYQALASPNLPDM